MYLIIIMRFRKSVIGLVQLFIGVVVYYLLAIIAILNYSGGFDLITDLWTHLRWFEYNPNGALYFRIGNLVYALTLIIFFLSISGLTMKDSENKLRIFLIQIIGIFIALSIVIGEILADQAIIFFIASGMNLLLTIFILIGFAYSFHTNPDFWKPSILLYITSIVLSAYLVFMGVIDTPIQEFRIVDFLETCLRQVSMCVIALNITKIRNP